MNNQLPAHLRMYVMVLITLIFYIPIFLFYVLFHREVFISTVNVFYHNNIALISLLLYSIINYSIAHLLWNKLNNKNNIVLTASAAFLIPLFSTLILSFSVKKHIGFAPSIGLILIVISIIINNRRYINSINATFASIVILVILTMFTPQINNENIINNSKFFLEPMIALFAIYYSFLMNRVINDFKEFQRLTDEVFIFKKNLTFKQRNKIKRLEQIIKKSKSIDIKMKKTISNYLPTNLKKTEYKNALELYLKLYRCNNKALSVSEWLIIIILVMLMNILCIIMRDGSALSSLIAVSIGSTLCLCISSLYEYQLKKETLLNNI